MFCPITYMNSLNYHKVKFGDNLYIKSVTNYTHFTAINGKINYNSSESPRGTGSSDIILLTFL